MGKQKLCVVCGKSVPPGRSKYCSDECMITASKHRKRQYSGRPRGNPKMIWSTTCVDCGAPITRSIKSIRCPACQEEINKKRQVEHKRHGAARPLGSIDKCQRCGKEYIVNSGLQKYCPDCRAEAILETKHQRAREHMAKLRADPIAHAKIKKNNATIILPKRCPACGKEFTKKGTALYCSDECRRAALRMYAKEYRQKNAAKLRAYQNEYRHKKSAERKAQKKSEDD